MSTETSENNVKTETPEVAPIGEIVSRLQHSHDVGDLIFGIGDAVPAEARDASVQEFRNQFPGASDELLVRIAAYECASFASCVDVLDSVSATLSAALIGVTIAEQAGLVSA